jgi:hypothetical protein
MKRRVAASLTTALWALFSFIGYGLTRDVAQQHVPGYPNAGQWHYYVYFPLAMLLVSVVLLALARRVPLALFVTVWTLQVLVFIPFFLGYTGGV